jgi:hypothetical protein
MQLAGTRGAGHRAGLVDTRCSRDPRRRSSVRWLGPAPGAAAPGVPGAGCSARRRPGGPPPGASPNDQQPVQALRADSADPPLRVGVRVRRLHRGHEHLDTLRPKHVIEPAAELRVSIANEEAHPASSFVQGQQQVARLLGDPGGIGIGGHTAQVDPAGIQLDEEQHIQLQPPQPDGIDGEEITGDDPGCLLAQKRLPGCGSPPWRRVQPVAAQRGADRGCRDLHAKLLELALDALVAPARVLLGQADDQLLDVVVERRSSLSSARVGPCARDESPVPAQQRLGLHQEARPAGSGQHAADRGEQGSVGGLKCGMWDVGRDGAAQ